MIAAGEGPHSGKMVCGQFGSFIPGKFPKLPHSFTVHEEFNRISGLVGRVHRRR